MTFILIIVVGLMLFALGVLVGYLVGHADGYARGHAVGRPRLYDQDADQ